MDFHKACKLAGVRWAPFIPKCRRCGDIMLHENGEPISLEGYEGAMGVCNRCLNKAKFVVRRMAD